MTTLHFNNTNKVLRGEINLPSSKSITNRALILKYLAKNSFSILNQSLADDSVLLDNMLKKLQVLSENKLTNEIFIDNAGTAMRFLTALLSITKGNWSLTGSERMKERPIAGLVDTLNLLGAQISYQDNIGFPPLLIKGNTIKGGSATIETNTSSQFITSV
ncbi:MAG: 3-phosphoshikimate 1-carboxyvinyltransferase, partial [Bacteroidales bacterium]